MQKIYLEKVIRLQHPLQELLAMSVDESINYKIENEGIRAVGNLIIKGEYQNNNKHTFEEVLELDILATFDKIIDQRDFCIKVEDFDYVINKDKISVTIEASVQGVVTGEDRYVQDHQQVEEIESLMKKDPLLQVDAQPITDLRVDPIQTTAKETKQVQEDKATKQVQEDKTIKQVKVDVDTSSKQHKGEGEHQMEDKKVEVVASSDDTPVNVSPKEDKKVALEENEHIQAVAKDIDDQLEEAVYENKARPIFQDTNDSVGTYYLYIVQEEDTYQSIAERYAGDELTIKEYNQNRELEKGCVLIIPYAP